MFILKGQNLKLVRNCKDKSVFVMMHTKLKSEHTKGQLDPEKMPHVYTLLDIPQVNCTIIDDLILFFLGGSVFSTKKIIAENVKPKIDCLYIYGKLKFKYQFSGSS